MAVESGQSLSHQVFINCPFDDLYRPLLRPILFTLTYVGFTPRIASESLNSAQNRIEKILTIIQESGSSVHDLSRCIATKPGEYFRANMPFEFGIDYGYNHFTQRGKKMLVLEGKRYDFQKIVSDISGVDVKCHDNNAQEVVKCIRNWIIEAGLLPACDSATQIWDRFGEFSNTFYHQRTAEGFSDDDLYNMPTPEYIQAIQTWVESN